MKKLIEVKPEKRGRGRPYAGGKDPIVGVRMPPTERHAVEAWAASQSPQVTLSKAVRHLMMIGLTIQTKADDKAVMRRKR